MSEKWEDIMEKNEVASAKHNELKEEKEEERFKEFMEMQAKKVDIEQKRLAVQTVCEESKVMYVKADDLDAHATLWFH